MTILKKERSELEQRLTEIVESNKNDKKSILKINDRLSALGVPYGEYNKIIINTKLLQDTDISLICVITEVLQSVLGNTIIDVMDYFSHNEINEAKENIKLIYQKDYLKLPITFEDVIQIDERSYSTKITIQMLVQMFNSQLINYDPRSQRGMRYKGNTRDGVVESPIVNQTSVKKIAQKILNQSYLADTITFNVFAYEHQPVTYDKENYTLTINEKSIISILDGYHRFQGQIKALNTKEDIDFVSPLSIRVYDNTTAEQYFGQINTINPLSKERRKELQAEKKSDNVVKELQNNPNSELRGIRIASSRKANKEVGQLTTFSILSFGIEKTFNPTNYVEYREVSDYLIKFFGYLIGFYYDEFIENPNKHTYINNPFMFLGYTVIAKRFYDENRELKSLKSVVNEINFEDNDLIEILESKRIYDNKKLQGELIKYFERTIK